MRIKMILAYLTFSLLMFSHSFAGEEAYNKNIVVEKILFTDTTAAGQALRFPDSASVTGIVVTVPVGGETGWHKHEYSGVAYILEGTLTVESENGSREFGPSSSFAEVVNMAHNGVNKGDVPVKLIAFFTAKSGDPISEKVKHPN